MYEFATLVKKKHMDDEKFACCPRNDGKIRQIKEISIELGEVRL